MNSYDSVTFSRRPVIPIILLATAIVAIVGISVSAAQDAEPSLVIARAAVAYELPPIVEQIAAPPSEEVLELVAQIEERDARITVLEEQLVFLRQAHLASQLRDDEQQDRVLAAHIVNRETPEFQAEAMVQWRAGFTLGGGKNLAAFEQTILPCESGGEPDPDMAVGATDDWGRSQINRPTWKVRFESLTGSNFEEHITNPILNGYMAAHVERQQGLNAWTCWRKR
ncbi:MAG: hypothetical protein ACI81L_001491 [Verrucomicrobiales bacterium]|jgi:hypothetical protein